MRPLNKSLSTAVAASVAAVVVGAVPASAATAAGGVGTTKTTTSVLSLQIGQNGSLLNLDLLRDNGLANIDANASKPGANNSLVALSLAAAGLKAATPAIGTSAPGGTPDVAGQTLALSSLGVPSAVATGTIMPAGLHSDYAPTAAHSSIGTAEIQNLTLAGGGLAKVDLLRSSLGANALSADADGARGVVVSNISLLDLGALLKGAGIDLSTLSVDTLSSLLNKLNLTVNGLAAGTPLASEVQTLTTTISGLQQAVATATASGTTSLGSLPSTVTNGINTISSTLSTPGLAKTAAVASPIAIPTSTTSATALVGTLQGQLGTLLGSALTALDAAPLVSISGTSVGITTKAADTVANSAAGVSALPLNVTVAGVTLPALDATAVASTVNGALSTANTALNGLLTSIGLPANLVSVSLLDKASNVGQNGAYTVATAGLTALTLTVAPVNPAALLQSVTGANATPISSLLSTAGVTSALPTLPASSAMGALNTVLGQAAPLLGGTTLKVASLSSASTYTVAPTATPTGTPTSPATTRLPRTGASPELGILGMLFAALALGGVRWARSNRMSQTQG